MSGLKEAESNSYDELITIAVSGKSHQPGNKKQQGEDQIRAGNLYKKPVMRDISPKTPLEQESFFPWSTLSNHS